MVNPRQGTARRHEKAGNWPHMCSCSFGGLKHAKFISKIFEDIPKQYFVTHCYIWKHGFNPVTTLWNRHQPIVLGSPSIGQGTKILTFVPVMETYWVDIRICHHIAVCSNLVVKKWAACSGHWRWHFMIFTSITCLNLLTLRLG